MSQIDVLLQYSSSADALADPALAPFVAKDRDGAVIGFNQACIFDCQGQGLQVWNTAADSTATVTAPDGQSITVLAHQFQPGYSLILTYADPSIEAGQINPDAASLAAWKGNAACLLIADADAAAIGDTGFIYFSSSAISATLAQWRVQPTRFNVDYPFGNPQALL